MAYNNQDHNSAIDLGQTFPKDTLVKFKGEIGKVMDVNDEKMTISLEKTGTVTHNLDGKNIDYLKKNLKKRGGGKKTRRLKKGGILGIENQGIFKDTNERLDKELNGLAERYAIIREQPNSSEKLQQILDIKIELLKIIKRGDKYVTDWIKNCKCKDEQDIIGNRSDKTVEIIGFLNSSIGSLVEAKIKGINENQKLNLEQLTDEKIPFDFEKAIQETKTAKNTATTSTGGKSNRTKRVGKKIRRKTNKRKTNKRRSRK